MDEVKESTTIRNEVREPAAIMNEVKESTMIMTGKRNQKDKYE